MKINKTTVACMKELQNVEVDECLYAMKGESSIKFLRNTSFQRMEMKIDIKSY